MEIRVLRYFLTAAQEESITKAAQLLHVTQPTLSRQIAQMESDMGVKLFERGTRKIVLTDEGLLLRRRAEEILALVDKTEQELTDQSQAVQGVVTIGCGDVAALRLLPELFRSFLLRYPGVTFDLYTATAEHVKDRMDRGLVDVGLLLEPVSMDKYEFIRVPDREEWVVVMPLDSTLAELDHVSPEDLKDLPLVLPRRHDVQSELAHWFGKYYDGLHILFTCDLPSTSSIIAYSKLAYPLITRGSISFWDQDKITYRPLYPPLTTTSVLAWRRQQPFGLAAEKFIKHIKDALPNCF